MNIDPMVINFILAWFIQMGFHEGAHAYAAYACGDDTAYLMGKRSFDPFKHIDWSNISSIILGIVIPIFSAFKGFIPMGMAWVPVNPLRFKKMRRDHALVSAAGPAANFAIAIAVLAVHKLIQIINYLYFIPLLDNLLFAIYLTSIVYGLFNTVPLPPLDGSRVLYYFLPPNLRQIMDDIEPYGFWILILFFTFGRAGEILSPFIGLAFFLW